jgi:hypothetical protein
VSSTSVVAAWFLAQWAGVIGWWVVLLLWPPSRAWFFPDAVLDPVMASFLAPDLAVLAGGSALTAWLVLQRHRAAPAVAWFTTGAACYAAVLTFAWAVRVDVPFASPLLMLASAVGSLACARLVVSPGR